MSIADRTARRVLARGTILLVPLVLSLGIVLSLSGPSLAQGDDVQPPTPPTDADGAETPACARSHALARTLSERGLAVSLQPEHLSSHEARRRARAIGRKRDRPVDDLAAAVILEDHLTSAGRRGSM